MDITLLIHIAITVITAGFAFMFGRSYGRSETVEKQRAAINSVNREVDELTESINELLEGNKTTVPTGVGEYADWHADNVSDPYFEGKDTLSSPSPVIPPKAKKKTKKTTSSEKPKKKKKANPATR